ncbi:hypothetical protein E2562_000807 [Oryza meyeriana var. granulata]|uniref:Uncharacterized protein n=1 Tax=Oryza meyeriana var. granulata TaxID=110450 RepID=A0A6G1DUS6_9ORYZ|nr:hypothetical protein E2562_000807 [Oryza meyeriana var. granulata]
MNSPLHRSALIPLLSPVRIGRPVAGGVQAALRRRSNNYDGATAPQAERRSRTGTEYHTAFHRLVGMTLISFLVWVQEDSCGRLKYFACLWQRPPIYLFVDDNVGTQGLIPTPPSMF